MLRVRCVPVPVKGMVCAGTGMVLGLPTHGIPVLYPRNFPSATCYCCGYSPIWNQMQEDLAPYSQLCAPKYCHLVPICSMKIRWNTTYAEVLHALDLKLGVVNMLDSFSPADVCCQALNQWIDSMDQSLLGKAKAAVKCCQKKWDWVLMNGKHGKVVRHSQSALHNHSIYFWS